MTPALPIAALGCLILLAGQTPSSATEPPTTARRSALSGPAIETHAPERAIRSLNLAQGLQILRSAILDDYGRTLSGHDQQLIARAAGNDKKHAAVALEISTLRRSIERKTQQLVLMTRRAASNPDAKAGLRHAAAVIKGGLANFSKLKTDLAIAEKAKDGLVRARRDIKLNQSDHTGRLGSLSAAEATGAILRHRAALAETERHHRHAAQARYALSRQKAENFLAMLAGQSTIKTALAPPSGYRPLPVKHLDEQPTPSVSSINIAARSSGSPIPQRQSFTQHVLTASTDREQQLVPYSRVHSIWETMPAAGEIIHADGSGGGFHVFDGKKQPVVAPGNGTIQFADRFKSFGRLLIINHGDGYHTLLSGLGQVDVEVGDRVVAGQIVGLVSAADTMGKSLYVELRHHGRPLNPVSWLAQRQLKKVQG